MSADALHEAGARAPDPKQLHSACGVPHRWRGAAHFTLLEVGWQRGLNFLGTVQAWKADPQRPTRLRYVAVLPAPLPAPQQGPAGVVNLDVDPTALHALRARWPLPIEGIHRIELEDGRVQLTLAVGDPHATLPGLLEQIDALLVSADSPRLPTLLQRAAQLLGKQAQAACAPDASDMLQALEAGGLVPEPGPTGAPVTLRPRERSGRKQVSPQGWPAPPSRRALIVGGALAGSAVAYALGRRGWQVDVLQDAPLTAAGSAQPVLAQHPSASRDDAVLSRLTRAALALSLGPYDNAAMRRIGRLQRMDEHMAHALSDGWPSALIEPVDIRRAAALSGLAGAGPGIWWPQAGCADPMTLIDAWRIAAVTRHENAPICTVRQTAHGWQALDAKGQVRAEAPVAIVAAGCGTPTLCVQAEATHTIDAMLGAAGWQQRRAQSFIAQVPPSSMPACILGGHGHAVPIDASHLLLGPGPDDVADPGDMTSRQRAAQAAWARHAGQAGDSNQPVSLRPAAWGARLSCRDHLPLIGALPDPAQLSRARESLMRNDRLPLPRLPGLWMASAFGGRGLLWSVLAAEVLAAHLEVEPMPLTHDLMAAIDPARFVRRALRRTKSM